MKKQPLKTAIPSAPRVEIINLIDVLVTLIAFFLFSTVFINRSSLDIQVPQVTNSLEQKQQQPKPAFIEITKQSRFYYQKKFVTKKELKQELGKLYQNSGQKAPLIIAADRGVAFQEIVAVLEILQKIGLEQVGFTVRQKE